MGAELFKTEGDSLLTLDFHSPDSGQKENICMRQMKDMVF